MKKEFLTKMTSNSSNVILIIVVILILIAGVLAFKGLIKTKQSEPLQNREEIMKREQRIEEELRENPSWGKVMKLFKEGRMLLNNSESEEEFLKSKELLEEAKVIVNSLEENYLTLYWKAKIDFELGTWFQAAWFEADENEREVAKAFTSAQGAVERSIKLNDDFSDSHRLLGEVLMRLIDFKGTLFAATNGPKAKKEIEKALKLNPENVEAHIALGLWFLFTPGLWGGNIDEAIRSLKRAEELAFDEHQRFLASMWLGKALLGKGKKEEAKGYFLKALEIYPKSGWAKKELEEAKNE